MNGVGSMKVSYTDSEVIIYGDDLDFKIASDRAIYYKKSSDKQFTKTKYKCPLGLSKYEKEIWLMKLRQKTLEEINHESEEHTESAGDGGGDSAAVDKLHGLE